MIRGIHHVAVHVRELNHLSTLGCGRDIEHNTYAGEMMALLEIRYFGAGVCVGLGSPHRSSRCIGGGTST
jgi:hypothetical protein